MLALGRGFVHARFLVTHLIELHGEQPAAGHCRTPSPD